MYQNFHYSKQQNTIFIWDDVDGLLKFSHEPYAYQMDSNGDYKTITGVKVKKVKSWSQEAEKQGLIFEHDVPVATRTLIDHYFESDEPSKNHRILFFDIEVEKGLKYSTTKEAQNPITSIAYYFNGEYVCLLLDKSGNISDCTKTVKVTGTERTVEVTLKGYPTERSLLNDFIKQWAKINPTIVSGWNSDTFDIPYTINRIVNVLGYQSAQYLSPIKTIIEREIGKDVFFKIAGVTSFDYMQLYKKFTYNEESSYSLENISQKELKRGKFKYEGTLDSLFENDIVGFIEYNVNDVELLVGLDKKLDLIEIARGICHKGHVPYDDYLFSSKYLEGALLTRCKRLGTVSISNLSKFTEITVDIDGLFVKNGKKWLSFTEYVKVKEPKPSTKIFILNDEEYEEIGTYVKAKNKKQIIVKSGKAQGAYVKSPQHGLHNWVYSVDLQSLYPSLIMTCNISPETQMYFVEGWQEFGIVNKLTKDGFTSIKECKQFGFLPDDVSLVLEPLNVSTFDFDPPTQLTLSKSEFIKFMLENDYIISAHGVIYHNKFKGLIPAILEEWFDERIKYKSKAKEYDKETEEFAYYDRKQLITKILLNSLYGVLLLPSFRFYNKMNGESVTVGGQNVIKFSDLVIQHYYNSKLGVTNSLPTIYNDTDSVAGNSLVWVDGNEERTLESVFENCKLDGHITDCSGRDFVFPTNLSLPYYDEKTSRILLGKVQYIEKHNVKKRRFKIETVCGKELIVTEDHSIMVMSQDGLVEKKPTDLTESDEIVVF